MASAGNVGYGISGPIGFFSGAFAGLLTEMILHGGLANTGTEKWFITVKGGDVKKELIYEREMQTEDLAEIFNDINFSDKVQKAEMITWITSRDRPPAGFSTLALENKDAHFRWKVIKTLGTPESLIPVLKDTVKALALLTEDKDQEIRQSAKMALLEIGKPAVEPLILALQDEDWSVRRVAAYTLGELKDPRAVEPLIAALKDKDRDVRRNAGLALSELKDPRAMEGVVGEK
ncbi:MAG: HEAT repeat domain-containing protein [Nitrospirae bacterium]|nr:HEAT repeat domain-containing protein [Nitrospirota bacterium]